jgi:hypothetical protein
MLARRPVIAFVSALLMWSPSAFAFVHEDLDLVNAAVRFLVALTVAWVGVTILALVVEGYGAPAQPRPLAPKRRKTDDEGPALADEESPLPG